MSNKDFKDPFIEKIYKNCKSNMTGTLSDWERVANFMFEMAKKYPEKTKALLDCYCKLEEEEREKGKVDARCQSM